MLQAGHGGRSLRFRRPAVANLPTGPIPTAARRRWLRYVTGRYASAPDAAVLSAADRVSLRLSDALDGTAGDDKVVPIERASAA